jgi:hypothetical protein
VTTGTLAATIAVMRRTVCLVVLGLSGSVAWAERPAIEVARAEMAAALIEQADLHPTPLSLPTMAAAPRHAASRSAVQRGIAPGGSRDAARAAASQASGRADARAASQAAQQAQAAAAAAAGQAQSRAAKERASRPRPR